jgi:hypothetical protein
MTLVEAYEVVAWFGGSRVPTRTVDTVDQQAVIVRVPTVIGETVLTIMTSTPEIPAAHAYWFPVDLGT